MLNMSVSAVREKWLNLGALFDHAHLKSIIKVRRILSPCIYPAIANGNTFQRNADVGGVKNGVG
jgi:hypothetical protein